MGTFLNESTIQENFPLRKHCPEFTNELEIKRTDFPKAQPL